MNDVLWIALIAYLSIWVIGGYFIWKAYRLGMKRDLKFATGPWQGKLKNPAKYIKRIAVIELITGSSILIFALAIPLFKIEMKAWGPFFLVIGMTRLSQQLKLARQNGP
ncbi:MAG: hypothetical protein Q8K52_01105 [Thiobacillus sp.]|nr:hypothetical protein [Thiobacillus sp.]